MDTTVLTPKLEPQSLSPSNSIRRRSIDYSNSSPEFEFWKVKRPSFSQTNLVAADELFSGGILLPLSVLSSNTQINHHDNLDDPPPESADTGEAQPILTEITVSQSGPPERQSEPGPSPDSDVSSSPASITADITTCAVLTASKRWKDIFKKSEKKSCSEETEKGKESRSKKEKKKERKSGNSSGGGGSNNVAELNINIWPFSRSRSAKNNASRPRASTAATRKVSSAPCSRSNSSGETKSRKSWPSSPGRGGVHLGRSSPVWQVRRAATGGKASSSNMTSRNNKNSSDGAVTTKKAEKSSIKDKKEANESRRKRLIKQVSNISVSGSNTAGGVGPAGGSGGVNKERVLNLNVPNLPMCIGYRHHLSCRSDEASGIGGGIISSSNAHEIGGSQRVNNINDGGGSGGGGEHHGGVGSFRNIGNGSNLFNIRNLFASKKVY